MTTTSTESHRRELLHAALEAAARGWHVFPCAPGTKHPGLKGNWQTLATTDTAQITAWWRTRPWNIGIACAPSGLVVIDLDLPGHGTKTAGTQAAEPTGAEALARLCHDQHQPLPPATYTVATPSGGTHLYYTAPDIPVGNSASKLASLVDIRAAGGYIVAAGSRTPAGQYTVLSAAPPAPLPAWIPEYLKSKNSTSKALSSERPLVTPAPPGPSYAKAALAEEHDTVATTAEGARNDQLNLSAFSLGQLVADGTLTEEQVTSALTDAAHSAGLEEREIARTIRNGLTAGKQHPRSHRAHTDHRQPPHDPRPSARPPEPSL